MKISARKYHIHEDEHISSSCLDCHSFEGKIKHHLWNIGRKSQISVAYLNNNSSVFFISENGQDQEVEKEKNPRAEVKVQSTKKAQF